MDKKLGGLLAVFFLMFVVFITVLYLSNSNQLVSFTRAKEDYQPSAKASLVFGYPLLVKADGTSKSTINIFIRSDKGMPVKNQELVVTTTFGDLSTTNVATNDQGKVSVTISSARAGTATITALIGGTTKVDQTLSIKFE